MSNNFARVQEAVALVAQRVAEVAAAIRNPDVNDDQVLLDDLASQLENAAAALALATTEENAEDGTPPAPEAPEAPAE